MTNTILPIFRNLLQAMDEKLKAPQWFDYKVEQIGPASFRYVFDGLLECEITFLQNGTVSEIVDTAPFTHPSIFSWVETTLKQFK